MKVLLALATLSFSAITLADPASQLCETIVKKGDLKKQLTAQDSTTLNACLNEVTAGQKKCQLQFTEAMKKASTSSKQGLITILEQSKKVTTCGTDVSIAAVKKFYK
jgi:hypothetical protein